MKIWTFIVILCLLIPVGVPVLAQGDEDEEGEPLVNVNEDNIKQATVFIMQTNSTPTGPVISCVGSGTLVKSTGVILTNAHLVESTTACPADKIVVALTLRLDEPPVPTYVADVVEFSRGLDLAVLQITSFLDGRSIAPDDLELPFVELGDSNEVQIDDTVLVVGYPSIGSDAITSVRGTITGFTAESNFGERSWIRTSAEIPGVMSGGGMYDQNGRLVGIPTIAPTRISGSVADCREVYDTNGNGQMDESDTCIPISGFISAIRPARLARGLVRAATLNIGLGPQRSPAEAVSTGLEPTFSRLFVTTGVNDAGMPINVITGAPTNTDTLYLFFDYSNMEDGMVYELRTTIDGRPSPIDSLPPVTWSGGAIGMWYIGGTRVPRPNGTYQYTLFIEGRQVATSDPITLGGGPRDIPQFSDIIFGIQNSNGEFVGANFVIPEVGLILARFNFLNMATGIQWEYVWYSGDTVLANVPVTWEFEATQGVFDNAVNVSHPSGGTFTSGRYRLELYIVQPETGRRTLSATSDFVMAGGAGGTNDAEALIFSDFRFARGERGTLPTSLVAEDFPTQSEAVYVFFNWNYISPGTPWTWRWYVDGEMLIEEHTRWNTENNGQNYYISLVGIPYLPDATYRFEIEINGIVMTDNLETKVGIGQLPVDLFASAEGIQVGGYILDAETGEGVAGAWFIILQADFSIEDFTWRQSEVLGKAQADEKGYFQLPVLVPRGTSDVALLYSILVQAEGYLPVSADGIAIDDQTKSPLLMTVELNRD